MHMLMFACALLGAAVAPNPTDVPELMRCEDGTTVESVRQWEETRRKEIMEFFTREEYGRRPVDRPEGLTFTKEEPDAVMMKGTAIRKRIRASWKGPRGTWSFVFTAFLPKAAVVRNVKSPAFVLICNRPPDENIDPTREKKSFFWPAEEIVDRGYAAIAFYNGDLAPDDKNPVFTNGVYRIYGDRGKDTWGALSAWAWGASRVMDWIETEPLLDAGHVGVVGHSRGGKTALVAGVTDRRFAMACSNDSGCSGAKLNHIDLPKSESIRIITGAFRHWFSLEYDKWADREREMPYDQHEWIALMAPRLVAIASASEDDWAGQLGEFHAARLASPAWELYGLKGLVAPVDPPTAGDRPKAGLAYQDGCVSYHIRPGTHTLAAYDWHRYMDFADRHGWREAARAASNPTQELFNGRDLSGWYKFLKGYGRDNDPQNVISVTKGVIRITGETWGALVTENAYDNYRLDVEYRWTGRKWPSKEKGALDSGILFHSTGPDGGFAGIWMFSHELNVIYGATGDIWTVGSKKKRPDMFVKSTARTVTDGKRTYLVYDPNGEEVTLVGNSRLARADIDPTWTDSPEAKAAVNENPVGEWNRATLVCRADEVECWFNGKLVNRATVRPSSGKIQLQSEGCEIEYRRVTLTRLDP